MLTKAHAIHSLTNHDDFKADERTITLSRHDFAIIADHLEQYQTYAEEMCAIGRGFCPSSSCSPELVRMIMQGALNTPSPKPPTPKGRKALELVKTDTASMTEAEVFAHYKRIGLRDDVKFFIDHAAGIPESVQLDAAMLYTDLLTRKATPADRKTYNRLTDTWRRATMTYTPVEIEEYAAA